MFPQEVASSAHCGALIAGTNLHRDGMVTGDGTSRHHYLKAA